MNTYAMIHNLIRRPKKQGKKLVKVNKNNQYNMKMMKSMKTKIIRKSAMKKISRITSPCTIMIKSNIYQWI